MSSRPTRLYLLRHGEVEERYHNIFNGRLDMGLSPLGHAQAERLAQHVAALGLEAVYASPMKRAQQTLAPLTARLPFRPHTRGELAEIDFGAWTGLNWDQIRSQFGVSPTQWLERLEAAGIPQAESAQALHARLQPCLEEIVRQHPGQVVALMCHGGVIRALLGLLLDMPLSRTAYFHIDYASVTQVDLHSDRTRLMLLNSVPWHDLVSCAETTAPATAAGMHATVTSTLKT